MILQQMKILYIILITLLITSCKPEPEACFELEKEEIMLWENLNIYNCGTSGKTFIWEIKGNENVILETENSSYDLLYRFEKAGKYDLIMTAYNRKNSKGKTNSITKSFIVKELEITEIIIVDVNDILTVDCPTLTNDPFYWHLSLLTPDPRIDVSSIDFIKEGDNTYRYKFINPIKVSRLNEIRFSFATNTLGYCSLSDYIYSINSPHNDSIVYTHHEEGVDFGLKFKTNY